MRIIVIITIISYNQFTYFKDTCLLPNTANIVFYHSKIGSLSNP